MTVNMVTTRYTDSK